MGRVFLCRSPVGRKLAVKVVREDRAADPVFRERFRREVEAARKVDGLHTAGVVDASLEGPELWLATEYKGPSLEGVVREHGPLPPGSLLALAAGLAEGLAAVHARGIVHRDLKPSNVLLAEDGPRVIDFGISRAAGDSGLTDVGQVMGTPRFMSPEQVCGGKVGPASDVFSLGSVLAFAATGHPPFGEDAPENVAQRIRGERPWLADLPDQIRDLAGRCLVRNPARRPTPEALVAELGDTHLAEGWLPAWLLNGSPRPAPARQDASVDTVRLGPRRAPSRGLTLLYSAPPFSPEALRPRVRRLARSVGRAPARAWVRGPRVILAAAAVALVALLTTGLTVLAASHGPGPFRGQLGRTLSYPRSSGLAAVAFSADGRFLAVGDSNGTAGVWTVATGARAATFRGSAWAGVSDVAFGPHGDLLTAAGNGSSYLWDVATGGRVGTFTDPDSAGVTGAAFGPDDSLLAAADDNGSAYLWHVATGRLAGTFTGPGRGRLTSIALGAQGGLLAAADEGGSAYLWHVATGRLAGTFTDPGGGVIEAVAFSPDGSLLAFADSNGNAYVWSVATGKLALTLPGPGPVSGGGVADVAFSAHGYLLATADANGNTYVWTVATGKLAGVLHDPSRGGGGVAAVAFSSDGSLLASAYINGHVYVWRTGSTGF
jgi:hypothetical protein